MYRTQARYTRLTMQQRAIDSGKVNSLSTETSNTKLPEAVQWSAFPWSGHVLNPLLTLPEAEHRQAIQGTSRHTDAALIILPGNKSKSEVNFFF